jgi:uncharacterized protein YceK
MFFSSLYAGITQLIFVSSFIDFDFITKIIPDMYINITYKLCVLVKKYKSLYPIIIGDLMKYLFAIVFGLILLVLFSGCISVMSIKDVKSDNYVGKEVTVEGIVQGTIKIGDLSGFTIKDLNDSIAVYSLNLPKDGETKTVKGTLRKVPFIGYYIEETYD